MEENIKKIICNILDRNVQSIHRGELLALAVSVIL